MNQLTLLLTHPSYSHPTSLILLSCSWFRQLFNNLSHSAPGLAHPTTLQPEPFGSDFNHYSYFILSYLTSIIIFIRSSSRQLFSNHNLTEPISLRIGYLKFLTSGWLVQCFNDWLCIFSNSQILPFIFFTHCCCPACCSFLEFFPNCLHSLYNDYPILQRESWSIVYLIHAGSLYFRYILLDLGLMALMRGVPARVALSPLGISSCVVPPALLVSCLLLCSCLEVCLAASPSSSVSSQLFTSSRMLS